MWTSTRSENVSNVTQEESYYIRVFGSVAEEVIYNIVCCTVILITLTGNSLVILLISSSKSLHTVFNLLILNMAVADLVFGCTGLLFYGSFVFTHYINSKNVLIHVAVFEIIACQITLCASDIFSKISVFTVALISLERYFAIKYPWKHKYFVTKKKILVTIVALWLISILLSTPIIVYVLSAFKNAPRRSDEYVSCYELAISEGMPPKVVTITELMAAYVLPMIIIVVTSYKIIKSLWRPRVELDGTNLAILRSRRLVTKLILSVAVAFNVFWLPWAIWVVLVLTGTLTAINYDKRVMFCVFLLQFANSGANPVLYSIRSRNFRRNLAKMLCRKSKKKKIQQ